MMADPKHGWFGTIEAFLAEDAEVITLALIRHLSQSLGRKAEQSQLTAWRQEILILKQSLRAVEEAREDTADWSLILEYELPRERGRRPDALILANDQVLVLEFKQDSSIRSSYLDQVAAYARDIQHYHAASHTLEVIPFLVMTNTQSLTELLAGTYRTSPDTLAAVIDNVVGVSAGEPIDAEAWVEADYAPLPSLVAAARLLFEHQPLPYIRRAQSAGIPEAVTALVKAAEMAQGDSAHHLALVTGVPGAGKTLVGLQFVYHSHFEDEDVKKAVFLSGNGPLVQVLQHALQSKVFVQDVHGFLRQYGGSQSSLPSEQIIVFDEAQRAWDAERVLQKRNHSTSEPEDFLTIGSRHQWSLLVGLIGEGQEIHLGEESGLGQWNEAIRATEGAWTVHCPNHIAPLFSAAHKVNVSEHLNLTTTLRSHLAAEVQQWVEQLLKGDLSSANMLAKKISNQGFVLYVTQDVEQGKAYLRERYSEQVDRRYGMLASSKAKNLEPYGVHNSYQYTKRLRVGPWYNDPPSSRDSCCQLREVATEFSCQGLELDCPLVCWGDDLRWNEDGWLSPARGQAKDPHQLRLNSYRVLLTRGRDGFLVFVPPEERMGPTYRALREAGLIELGSDHLVGSVPQFTARASSTFNDDLEAKSPGSLESPKLTIDNITPERILALRPMQSASIASKAAKRKLNLTLTSMGYSGKYLEDKKATVWQGPEGHFRVRHEDGTLTREL